MGGEDLEMGTNYAMDDKLVAEEREENAWVPPLPPANHLDTEIELSAAHFWYLYILGKVYPVILVEGHSKHDHLHHFNKNAFQ